MEAEKVYQKKVPRTIQHKHNGTGKGLEIADNCSNTEVREQNNKIFAQNIAQFQVPIIVGGAKPNYRLAKPYNPHGANLRVTRDMPRPSWQSGYRDAFFRIKCGTSNPSQSITDVMGVTAPLWAMEMDHIIPWSRFRDVMAADRGYSVQEARLYYHDMDNLQILNSHENRRKTDNDGPSYEVPDVDPYLGDLPKTVLGKLSSLVYDINNTTQFLNRETIINIRYSYRTIEQIIDNLRRNM